jgi:hypothetical protein
MEFNAKGKETEQKLREISEEAGVDIKDSFSAQLKDYPPYLNIQKLWIEFSTKLAEQIDSIESDFDSLADLTSAQLKVQNEYYNAHVAENPIDKAIANFKLNVIDVFVKRKEKEPGGLDWLSVSGKEVDVDFWKEWPIKS